jgi:hypothetical protein
MGLDKIERIVPLPAGGERDKRKRGLSIEAPYGG